MVQTVRGHDEAKKKKKKRDDDECGGSLRIFGVVLLFNM